MRPRIKAISCAEMASPKPVPPYFRVVELSDWMNGSKISCCFDGRDADAGIANREPDADLFVVSTLNGHQQHHFAALGELDGVADQVDEHLPQPAGVAHQHLGHVRRNRVGQLEVLLVGPHAERFERIAQAVVEVEIDGVDVEPAGFDLRKVEDVVDDRQQRIGPRASPAPSARAARGSRVASRASSVMPMMPFIGVRSSWLMLARNSLFARLAASATSLACRISSVCLRWVISRRLMITPCTAASPSKL